MFDKMSADHGDDALSRQREAEEKLKGGWWMREPLSYLHFLYFVFVYVRERSGREIEGWKVDGGASFLFAFLVFCICIS